MEIVLSHRKVWNTQIKRGFEGYMKENKVTCIVRCTWMLLKEESVVTLYLVGKNVNNFTRHSLCKRLHGGNTRGHIQGELRLEISNFEYLILF